MKKQEQPSIKTGIMIIVLTIAIFASALSYNNEDKITGSITRITGMVTYRVGVSSFSHDDYGDYIYTNDGWYTRDKGTTNWYKSERDVERLGDWDHTRATNPNYPKYHPFDVTTLFVHGMTYTNEDETRFTYISEEYISEEYISEDVDEPYFEAHIKNGKVQATESPRFALASYIEDPEDNARVDPDYTPQILSENLLPSGSPFSDNMRHQQRINNLQNNGITSNQISSTPQSTLQYTPVGTTTPITVQQYRSGAIPGYQDIPELYGSYYYQDSEDKYHFITPQIGDKFNNQDITELTITSRDNNGVWQLTTTTTDEITEKPPLNAEPTIIYYADNTLEANNLVSANLNINDIPKEITVERADGQSVDLIRYDEGDLPLFKEDSRLFKHYYVKGTGNSVDNKPQFYKPEKDDAFELNIGEETRIVEYVLTQTEGYQFREKLDITPDTIQSSSPVQGRDDTVETTWTKTPGTFFDSGKRIRYEAYVTEDNEVIFIRETFKGVRLSILIYSREGDVVGYIGEGKFNFHPPPNNDWGGESLENVGRISSTYEGQGTILDLNQHKKPFTHVGREVVVEQPLPIELPQELFGGIFNTGSSFAYIIDKDDKGNPVIIQIQTDDQGEPILNGAGKPIPLEKGKTITIDRTSLNKLLDENQRNSFVTALFQTGIEKITKKNYNEQGGFWMIGNEQYYIMDDEDQGTKTIVYSPIVQNRYTEYFADGSKLVAEGVNIILLTQEGPKINPDKVTIKTGFDNQNIMSFRSIYKRKKDKEGNILKTTISTTEWMKKGDYWSTGSKGEPLRIITRTVIKPKEKLKDIDQEVEEETIRIRELGDGFFESDGKIYDELGNELIVDENGVKRKGGKRNKLIGNMIKGSEKDARKRAGRLATIGSDIYKYIDLTSGYSFVGFFYSEPNFVYYDERLMHVLGGTEGWSAEVCKKSILDDAYGLEDGYAFSLSPVGASAHIEGEKIPIMNYTDPNPTQFYYYKISFEVNPGSRVTGCDLNFETYLKDNGNYIPLMTDDSGSVYTWDLKRGNGSVSYTGLNMRFFPSKKEYTKACIKFNSIIPRTGRTCLIGINEGDYLCNKITLGAEQEFNTELHGLGSYAAWLFGGGKSEGTEITTGAGTTPDQGEAKLNPKI